MTSPLEAIVAMDLGGTQMRAAWVASDNTISPILRRPTNANRPAEACFADQLRLIRDVVDQAQSQSLAVAGVAVGAPSPADREGRLNPSGNLPTMGGFPLRRRLTNTLGLEVSVHNDANCFAMGEASRTAQTESFCGVTLGTGLGVGIVIGGRLHLGPHNQAGEMWKSPWPGGTIEHSLSGAALEANYQKRMGQSLTAAEITELAQRGDAIARDVYNVFGEALGGALAWLINLIDPTAVALGGSVANAFALYEPSMRSVLESHVVVSPLPRVYPSEHQDHSTLLGAVCLHKATFTDTKNKPEDN